MQSYFYVDIDDEITTIVGKLKKEIDSDEIFLVVPKRALIAQSLVNLQLLDKEAKKIRKKIIFVSPDSHTRKLAEKAGLEVKKYVVKKDEGSNSENLAQAPTRPLTQLEEEAAKRELKSLIDKGDKLGKADVQPKSLKPSKVKAGVFSLPQPNLHPAPLPATHTAHKLPVQNKRGDISKKASQRIVDLKKLKAGKKTLLKEKAVIIKKPIATSEENLLSRKDILRFKGLPREDLLSTPIPNEVTGFGNALDNKAPVLAKTSKEIIKNPFKVRPLKKNRYESDIPKKLALKPEKKENETHVPQKLEEINHQQKPEARPESPQDVSHIDKNEKSLSEFDNFQREVANLTLKEKERLKDLWMQHKRLIRGKSFQSAAKIDLKKNNEDSSNNPKEIFRHEENGILKTTRRKVMSSGKVIDLRSRSMPLISYQIGNINQPAEGKKREILLPLMNVKVFAIFFIGILIILAILGGIILPRAEITLTPQNKASQFEMKFQINGEIAEVNTATKTVPGKPIRFKISKEGQFTASAEKDIQEKARGQVAIYNNSEEPISLKQNTILIGASGKKYYTLSPLKIPGAVVGQDEGNANSNSQENQNSSLKSGSALVEVVSHEAGKEYDAKEGSPLVISGSSDDLVNDLKIEVKRAISGGDERKVKYISTSDIENAKNSLTEELKKMSAEELNKNIDLNNKNLLYPKDLELENVIFSSSKAENEVAESFTASSEITFFTLSFSKEDLKSLAKKVVEEDKAEKNGSIDIIEFRPVNVNPLENQMEISANLSYKLKSYPDSGQISREIVAKKKSEAQEYLNRSNEIEKYDLKLFPRWLPWMPLLEKNIKVEVLESGN